MHTAFVILNGILPRSLIDLRVWVVSSTDFSVFIDAEGPDINVRWNIAADGDFDRDREQDVIADMLGRGELAAIIERDGRIIAWDNFATGIFVKEDWLRFKIRDHEIYSSWSFVLPEYRGQGLAVALAIFAYREFARWGYLCDYSLTDALNRRALRSSAKVHHWPIGRIAYGRCCGFTVIRIGRRLRAGFWSADNPLVIDFSAFDNP